VPAERHLSAQAVDQAYRAGIARLFGRLDPESGWEFTFAEGHPGKVLVQQAAGAALLAIGTQEMVGLGRILMGSVSHHTLSHARCPVVAVGGLPCTEPSVHGNLGRICRPSDDHR
jgi:nucleotide-binding universal stress UspA family protein